jgi:hypothetical protein
VEGSSGEEGVKEMILSSLPSFRFSFSAFFLLSSFPLCPFPPLSPLDLSFYLYQRVPKVLN